MPCHGSRSRGRWRYPAGMADEKDRDLRVSLKPLSGEEALRALLKVDPDSEPVEPEDESKRKARTKD
jgi:hypothetical protein